MALKAILDSIDSLPDAIKAEYRPGTADEKLEGKFVLAVDAVSGFALENVDGLKSALGSERQTRQQLEGKITAFGDLDPVKVKTDLEKYEALKAIDPKQEAGKLAEAQFESAKAQLIAQHQQELEPLKGETQKLRGEVSKLLVDAAAVTALSNAKGSTDLLLPHVQRHTRVAEKDGKFVVEVIDGSGVPRIGDSQGNPMTIDQLVSEMKKDSKFARAFDADEPEGSGNRPSNAPNGGAQKGDVGGDKTDRSKHYAAKFNVPVD